MSDGLTVSVQDTWDQRVWSSWPELKYADATAEHAGHRRTRHLGQGPTGQTDALITHAVALFTRS